MDPVLRRVMEQHCRLWDWRPESRPESKKHLEPGWLGSELREGSRRDVRNKLGCLQLVECGGSRSQEQKVLLTGNKEL